MKRKRKAAGEKKAKVKYYKWTAGGGPIYGRGKYVLDGKWQPNIKGKLLPCNRGYHVCRKEDLPHWRGTELYEVEVDEKGLVKSRDKVVVRTFRVVRKLAWGLQDMKDCAEADADAADRATQNVMTSYARSYAAYAIRCKKVLLLLPNGAECEGARLAALISEDASKAVFLANPSDPRGKDRDRQREWILRRVRENMKREAKGGA